MLSSSNKKDGYSKGCNRVTKRNIKSSLFSRSTIMIVFIPILLTAIGFIIFVHYQSSKDKNDYSLKEEYQHFLQNSETFRTVLEKKGLHFDTNYKEVKQAITAAKKNERIQAELQKSRDTKTKIQEVVQEFELFKFLNVDILLDGFCDKNVITKKDFINNLRKSYSRYDDCVALLNSFEQRGFIKNYQGLPDLYEVSITYLIHPYKKDSIGQNLSITFDEYMALPQKSSWRA